MVAPFVIGGSPGSGTRVVARIVERAKVFLGTHRTGAEDAIEFWELYDRWVNRYALRDLAPLCREEAELMKRDLFRCIERHRRLISAPELRWGWKNPRSMLLLPFLNEQLPEMRFIHLIRDGRDMAFSENRYDVQRHGPAILRDRLTNAPQEVKAAAVWARTNTTAFEFASRFMSLRYLLVTYETLCREPIKTVERILSFIGGEAVDAAETASQLIHPQPTLGRWRSHLDETSVRLIEPEIEEALNKFGYS